MSKKIAICMSGFPAALNHVYENLLHYFNNYLKNYDIYGYFPEYEGQSDIKNLLPFKEIKFSADTPIDEHGIKGTFKTGVQKYLQQLNGWKKSNEMRKDSGISYDYIIRCRPDVQFKSPWPHVADFPEHALIIPHFHHFLDGINDRFCIGPPTLIDNYMNIIDEAFLNPGLCTHAEPFLKKCLIKSQTPIQLSSIFFDRVRASGTVNVDHPDVCNTLDYPKNLTLNAN